MLNVPFVWSKGDNHYAMDPWQWMTFLQVTALQHYAIAMEESLPAVIEKGRAELFPDDSGDGLSGIWKLVYETVMPGNFRYSFVVLAYIILESRLTHVCDELKKRILGITELGESERHRDIKECKRFCRDVVKQPLEDFPQWQSLIDLQHVRNCIVHAHGQIWLSRQSKYLRNLVQRGIGIGAVQGLDPRFEHLVIERAYCERVPLELWAFFHEFFMRMPWGWPPKETEIASEVTSE